MFPGSTAALVLLLQALHVCVSTRTRHVRVSESARNSMGERERARERERERESIELLDISSSHKP